MTQAVSGCGGGSSRDRTPRWTTLMDNVATLETAVPELPAGFDNRFGDNWRLMLAIADLAGGEWADQARQAATAIARVVAATYGRVAKKPG
jgi:hypothetical protein